MEKIQYKGWPNCIRMANSAAELILTTDVGPRILHFALRGGPNAFFVDEETAGRTGDAEFHSYGGHRLWHAPESMPRTYVPDNHPVQAIQTAEGIRLVPPVEEPTGIQKEWLVQLSPKSPHIRVVHRMTNTGLWPVRLAAWAISVMAPGGVGILPLPPRGPHHLNLLPTGSLALWAYTNMADPRWHWGEKYILLRQDPGQTQSQKAGLTTLPGWVGYASQTSLFLKLFQHDPSREYPDLGSSAEMFTNKNILEVETLGPYLTLEPGGTAEHTEDWFLFDGVPLLRNDVDIEKYVLPRVQEATEKLSQST